MNNALVLPSSKALAMKQVRQMGQWAYIRHCKNLGIDLDTVLNLLLGVSERFVELA
jgi:hypothetical protein